MCGITGFFRPGDRADLTGDERAVLGRMNDAITHRGPDEDGFFHGHGVGLAARRLSIIDIATSHQPGSGPSGKTTVVFNGEIYNYQAIRKELMELGHEFTTTGDTEVLPHGYEAWGIQGLLERLNGMFAFALHDARTNEVFIARDRLGIKPLHLGEFDGTFVFGSELKSLILHPSVRRDVDPDALARYLVMEYVPSPKSIYRGICKVRPGHYVRLSADGDRPRADHVRYWQLDWSKGRRWDHDLELPAPDAGEAEWSRALLAALRDAVKLRLVSEVPIGGLLSGGLDSSSISALMAEMVPDLRTFSIGFEEASFDESAHARAVAEHIRSQHNERTFRADDLQTALDSVRGFLDEPFADASILPTWFLSRMVKDHGVTVVLSGDGADELFAGYPTYLAQRVARGLDRLPAGGLLTRAMGKGAAMLPSSYENVSADYKVRRFLAGADLAPARRQVTWLGSLLEGEMRSVLAPDLAATLAADTPWAEIDAHHDGALGADTDERLLHLDLHTYMGDDILVKVDRASMAVGLEARVPFLDHRLVEFAARMPFRHKLKGRTGKHILKRTMGPRLPVEIAARGKKGFGLPVAKWLHGPFRELLLDTLGNGRAAATGRLNQAAVDTLIDEHLSGKLDRRKPLWTLLMFRWWEDGAFGPGGGP
jgi:asparagine synthase (glutamine-hydrolysing)